MSFEIPTDLIRQVQINLRKEAGLSSYDPNDPTLPALPSLDASIAEFDPSPPYLRCKTCKGPLLRGIQSAICIYCGKQQQKEVPPDPIPFKSTLGYKCLLQSLQLDGSEIVGPSIEESESNKGQSRPKTEISLSDLLDLRVPWVIEPEISDTGVAKSFLAQSRSSLYLTGADIDNYFTESKGDNIIGASGERPIIQKQVESTESKAVAGQDNLSLFQSFQPSETVVRSTVDEKDDAFSGWEADFQSANSENRYEQSKSFKTYMGSTTDLSAHMDSIFGFGNELKDGKTMDNSVVAPVNIELIQGDPWNSVDPVISQKSELFDCTVKAKNGSSSTPIANDWMQGDFWNNVRSVVPQPAEQFDATLKAKDRPGPENLNNSSSANSDWFQYSQWQTKSKNSSKGSDDWFQDSQWPANIKDAPNKTISQKDNTYGEWNDFTSSTIAQDQNTQTQGEEPSEINLFSSANNFQDMDFGEFSEADLFPGSTGNQSGSPEQVKGVLKEVYSADRNLVHLDNVGGSTGEVAKNGIEINTNTGSKEEAEMLMSQMHDLSFMLESNLSVPSKLDTHHAPF